MRVLITGLGGVLYTVLLLLAISGCTSYQQGQSVEQEIAQTHSNDKPVASATATTLPIAEVSGEEG